MKPSPLSRERAPAAPHLHPFAYKSVAATHPGCVRALNEDACLDRPDIGLWAVADGMGGHHAGDLASALVVRELDKVETFESAYAFRAGVAAALARVNAKLQAIALEELVDLIGATVVTLIVHGPYYACLWAGDSRCYLRRNGVFYQLTRDHTLARDLPNADLGERQTGSHIVTRAVGAHSKLDLEGVYGRVESGDRFLLCSDGLAVNNEMLIAGELERANLSECAARLIRRSLAAGAPDNVSMVILDCDAA